MTEADPRRWTALPVILVASFMGLFDVFIVNVAAPDFQQDLHASSSELQLVIAGYAFFYAAFLVTGGRLGDRYSYRRLFIGGMTVFTLASAACGLAGSSGELILSRSVQGLGAAMMVPQVLALITALFPPHERHQALAWFGVSIGMGAVAGQVIGGALVQLDLFGWGWRTIFFVNIPIGIVTIALATRLLPHNRSSAHPQLDLLGVIGVTGSLALALVPLTLGRSQGWPLVADRLAPARSARVRARRLVRGASRPPRWAARARSLALQGPVVQRRASRQRLRVCVLRQRPARADALPATRPRALPARSRARLRPARRLVRRDLAPRAAVGRPLRPARRDLRASRRPRRSGGDVPR